MAHACNLYFFVKMSKKAPGRKILTTVVWNLGRNEQTATKGVEVKQLKIDVSGSLGAGGSQVGPDVRFDIFPINNRAVDERAALAMLNDPAFTWKDDALAITLHCVQVAMVDQPEPNPFCIPQP